MKRALLIGIDDYDLFAPLTGCVNDVTATVPLLARNEDDSPNFDCQQLTSATGRADRARILAGIEALLAPGADVALLYFAGHGARHEHDVSLVTQDGTRTEAGVSLSTVLGKIQSSAVGEIIVILDCCFSGGAGGAPQLGSDAAVLRHGVSLLTATRADQLAEEDHGRGIFSTYLCGALDGGAADVLGKVTLASIYAYLSESFGPWNQRPTFKTNVDRLHELRVCSPALPLSKLRRLPDIFLNPDFELPLDPSYEPDAEPKDPEREAIFAILQECRAAKLVEPVGADHLYFAAMESKSCRLTPLGKLYRRMAQQNRL